MRISDWSSDVCSSDLRGADARSRGCRAMVTVHLHPCEPREPFREEGPPSPLRRSAQAQAVGSGVPVQRLAEHLRSEERRVGKSVSVRLDLGGRRIIKKKTIK